MREIIRPEMPDQWMEDTLTPKRWKWYEPACYSFPRRWHRVARARGMTLAAYRLFYGLLAHMGWENRVTESVARVARACEIEKRSVSRALRILEEAHLICVDRSNPTLLRITVSPFLVWQGRPHLLYKARKAFEERCRLSARQRSGARTHTPVPR